MLWPILIGIGLIIATIIVEIVFIELAQNFLNRRGNRILGRGTFIRKVIVLCGTTIWLLAALSLAIWIWAVGFYRLGLAENFESAVYVAMVTFTTLGQGGMDLPPDWRLLAGVSGANGLILLGLNTAILIDVMARMRDGDMRTYNDD